MQVPLHPAALLPCAGRSRQASLIYTFIMLPHSPKDNKSFHNLARELLPLLGSNYNPPRQVRKKRPHPKDFSGVAEKGDTSSSNKKNSKKTSADAPDTSSIPDPIPDTGIQTLAPPAGSTLFVLPPVSQALSVAEASIYSMAMPPGPTTTASVLLTPSPTTSASASSVEAASMHQQNSERLPTTFITLIAVGSVFALVGILIVFKICNGPRKRVHPVPSNPIMQDDDYSEKYGGDDSPLFGGKDRLSGANSGHTNSTLWPWTQYHSGILKPAPPAAPANAGSNSGGAVGYVATEREKKQYPLAGLAIPGTNPGGMLQPVQNAVTRVASRLSTVSMSLYPNSPRDPRDVGLAIDGDAYTADNLPVLKRAKSTSRRRSNNPRPDSTRVTAYTRYSQGSTYNGVDIDSLPIASQSLPKITIAPATNTCGRAPVKSSYYAPGAYPRVSNLDSNILSADKNNPFADSQDELRPLQRSGSRRDRNTRALTSALGLASPIPASPQPTLYPEDSLSMAGEYLPGPAPSKSNVRDYIKPVLKAPVTGHRLSTPPVDSPTILGSMMLVDFGSGLITSKSAESLADKNIGGILRRANDKPPRVPSPPPLPSLTQMGLAHAHPEAYATYQSPTYSIYGLYEADRKSKATSFRY